MDSLLSRHAAGNYEFKDEPGAAGDSPEFR